MPSMELHMDPADHPSAGVENSQGQNEHHSSQQQPVAGQQQQPLTHTVQSGLEAISSRKQDIHAKIDELAQVVLHQLEQTKVNFLQWLDGYKKMVDEFGETVVHDNSAVAADTIAAQIRLGRAQQLVSSLGLEVMNPPAEGMEDMTGA